MTTTSRPTTPVQLNPFVQPTNVACVKLVCEQGKLNVNAKKNKKKQRQE